MGATLPTKSYSDRLSSHVIVGGLENADIQEKVLACEDGVRGKNQVMFLYQLI